MWCRHCQQDVPAAHSAIRNRLVCPRCETPVGDEFPSDPEQPVDPAAAKTLMESESKLRALGRPLRASTRREENEPFYFLEKVPAAAGPQVRLRTDRPAKGDRRGRRASWWLGLILTAGVGGLIAGVVTLLWSSAIQSQQLWRIGMTATIASEGTLVVGLLWMATKLWNSSRWVNRNIDGLHTRIDRLEDATKGVWDAPHWQSGDAFEGYRAICARGHALPVAAGKPR